MTFVIYFGPQTRRQVLPGLSNWARKPARLLGLP